MLSRAVTGLAGGERGLWNNNNRQRGAGLPLPSLSATALLGGSSRGGDRSCGSYQNRGHTQGPPGGFTRLSMESANVAQFVRDLDVTRHALNKILCLLLVPFTAQPLAPSPSLAPRLRAGSPSRPCTASLQSLKGGNGEDERYPATYLVSGLLPCWNGRRTQHAAAGPSIMRNCRAICRSCQ